MTKQLCLDRGPVGDDRVLAHDDDSVLDDVALILVVRVRDVVLVDDLAVHTDARVLVDDRAADRGAGTDADGEHYNDCGAYAAATIFFLVFQVL